jgi:Predicted ATPase with chaperone activity
MNPCRCGYLADASRACARAPQCAQAYQGRISGPLFDRIDLHIEVGEISSEDLDREATGESSMTVAERVKKAQNIQEERYRSLGASFRLNAHADGELLDQVACLDEKARALLKKAAESFRLSARGYRRVLRVARTLADMAQLEIITETLIAEALSYRRLYF